MSESRLRKRPAQARSRQTVDAILEAADRLLRREGYATASTNRIAQVAGFSIGSLYQYFDDKRAVFGALIDRELERDARELAQAADALAAAPPPELCAGVVARLLERRGSQRHLYRALVQHADELADGSALDHLLRIQTPLAGDALQRALAPRVCGRPLDALLCALARWIHAAALQWAAEEPGFVPPAALHAEIGRVVEAYLAEPRAASPEARRWLERWAERLRARSETPSRAWLLQDARAHVHAHAAEGDPAALEARVLTAAGLVELLGYAHGRTRSEEEQAALLGEVARLGDAALLPVPAAGSLPRIA